jgi:hypothetical protein
MTIATVKMATPLDSVLSAATISTTTKLTPQPKR